MFGNKSTHIALSAFLTVLLSTLIVLLNIFSNSSLQVTAADDCQTFSETGFKVCGKFLTYWKTKGGLAQQGFPISDVFDEQNQPPPAGDGKVHKVQYFQRARFEEHQENQPPYDVLLGLLGAEQYKTKYGTQPAQGTPFLVVNAKRTQDKIDNQVPKPGYTFFILDFTLTNTLGKPIETNLNFFKVQSDQNFSYEYASESFLLPKGFKDSKLAPGEINRGELAFEIPPGEVIKSFRYEDFKDKITIPIQ